jgi:eukaryotic-like serine/threonine-protein kinase
MVGRALNHYQILEKLGEGGMGVVYKARDTHLDRFVAIKVLPPEKVADPERKARFVQEAKAASALNHPNIITIYDISSDGGTDFIAMEYVAGKTLDQIIPRKGMRLNEALKIAVQVTDALSRAHAAGIIHRDLKPANVMADEHGTVKILDFGLAKLAEEIVSDEAPTKPLDVMTEEGTIVGTAAYMSPEQAEAKPLDGRSDIFSFGAVLYEMITGRRAFRGSTSLSTLSAVLRDEPKPLCEIRAETPDELGRVVARCLRKEPGRRFQHMSDLAVALKELREESESGRRAVAVPKRRRWRRWGLIAAAVIVLAAGGAAVWRIDWPAFGGAAPGSVQASQLTLSPGLSMGASLSPDGASIAFSSNRSGRFEVYVRSAAPGGSERQLTSDGQQNIEPSWAPDGKTIAYHSVGRQGIWLAPATGSSSPRQLAPFGSRPSWSPDGSRVAFRSAAPNDLAWFDWGGVGESTIFTVDADGSHLHQVTIAGNPAGRHADPVWSSDGNHIIFASLGQMGARSSRNTLWAVDPASGELKQIATGNLVNQVSPALSPDRQTVYFGAMGADGFAIYSTQLSGGTPAAVLYRTGKDVPTGIAVSRDGKRLFFTRMRTLSQIWQTGTESSPAKALYQDEVVRAKLPAYSPDGGHLAYVVQPRNAIQDVWMMNADGSNATPVVSDQGLANGPGWTADGTAIWYSFMTPGGFQIRRFRPADGSQQVLLDSKEVHTRAHLTPDMREMVYDSGRPLNIWIRPLQGGSPRQLTFDREGAGFPVLSADGQWIAYQLFRGEQTAISLMDRNGGRQQTVLGDPGVHYPFSFSSDNRRIAYAACPKGVWNIYWVDRITAETKQVTNYTAYGSVVRSPAWRPGAEQMAFEYTEVKGNVYAIDLPGLNR